MKYDVVVKQTLIQYKVFTVEASNADEAADIAERDASELDFWSWDEIDTNEFEVIDVEPAGH
jgi:hypothetical protein